MHTGKQIKKAIQFSEIIIKLNNNLFVNLLKNNKKYVLCKLTLINTCREYTLMFTANELKRNEGWSSSFIKYEVGILYYLQLRDIAFYLFTDGDKVYCITDRLFKRAFARSNTFILRKG